MSRKAGAKKQRTGLQRCDVGGADTRPLCHRPFERRSKKCAQPMCLRFSNSIPDMFCNICGSGYEPNLASQLCMGPVSVHSLYISCFYRGHTVRHMKAMKAMQEGLAAVRAEVKKCVAQTPMRLLILV